MYYNRKCIFIISVSSSSSSKKKRKSSVKEVIGEKNKEFGASLLIYDKRKSNLLKNGFYDCIVEEINTNRIPCVNKSASWTYFNVNVLDNY